MNHEISFPLLLKTFKKCWWKVMIIAICAMLIMGAFTVYFIPKKYSSSMEVYIINSNASYDYTTSSLLSANVYLINDYIAIMQGDAMLKTVCKELREEAATYVDTDGNPFLNEEQVNALSKLEPGHIRSMVRSSASPESSIFRFSISHTDPKLAYTIARKIAEVAPAEVTKIAKSDKSDDIERQDCISIIIEPKMSSSHDSPNVPVYTVLAGIAAAVIAYVVFLLLGLSKSVIVTEEDVKRNLDYPLIGIIPHWSVSNAKNPKN